MILLGTIHQAFATLSYRMESVYLAIMNTKLCIVAV